MFPFTRQRVFARGRAEIALSKWALEKGLRRAAMAVLVVFVVVLVLYEVVQFPNEHRQGCFWLMRANEYGMSSG